MAYAVSHSDDMQSIDGLMLAAVCASVMYVLCVSGMAGAFVALTEENRAHRAKVRSDCFSSGEDSPLFVRTDPVDRIRRSGRLAVAPLFNFPCNLPQTMCYGPELMQENGSRNDGRDGTATAAARGVTIDTFDAADAFDHYIRAVYHGRTTVT